MRLSKNQILSYSLTTKRCKDVLEYVLAKPRWSLARIARAMDVAPEYVRRVQLGQQSLQIFDLESLAEACGLLSHELIFNSIKKDELPARKRGLYDLVKRDVERHREFEAIMMRKPVKKPRSRSTATAVKTSTKPAARRAFART
jgi:hypothetical protein